MKPAWDKLMKEYKGSKTALVADVDCTTDGKPLCDANGVQGFPTLKYGDPNALEKYEGGRDFDTLKSFADENLKPLCSPANQDLCEEDQLAELKKYLDMDMADLESAIKDGDDKIAGAEETFKTELEQLQNAYQKLMKDKDDTIAEVKASGLGTMKSVLAYKKSGAADKEEL
jgi:hypothetical protein